MVSKKHLILFIALFSASSCLLVFVQLYPKNLTVLKSSETEELILELTVHNRHELIQNTEMNDIITTESKPNVPVLYQSVNRSVSVVLPPVAFDHFVVPNVVHFVFFTKIRRPLLFTEMASILSAYQNQQPDEIYLHCNIEPVGNWWLELLTKVKLKVIFRKIPTRIGNFNVSKIQHAADIAKLEILMQYGGGIILDYDVIVLNSLDPLRKYNISMGKEKAPKLNAGIIVASNDSKFLHRWYKSYVEEYKSDSWDYNCCACPYYLMLQHYDWIHIEDVKLTSPDWMDRQLLYTVNSNSEILAWKEFYVIHMMFHNNENRIYDPVYIKSLRNLIGKALRLIYYGSENELSDFVPWVYYSKHPMVYNGTK